MDDKATILYIDDERINVTLFEINFKKKFNVLCAQSGIEGLEILKANPQIKIILTDMKMPGMNGIEFVTKAKNSYPDKIFFILTGYGLIPEIGEALKSQLIHNYFSKPFNIKEIEKSILSLLN